MAKQVKNALGRELTGILYLSFSILLACSLISYDSRDLSFIQTPPTNNNWIGVFGAYLGFGVYSFIGWSANLMPLMIVFLGFSALFRQNYRPKNSTLWIVIFLLSISCLLQALGWGDISWTRENNNSFGIGGCWGYWVGGKIFIAIFGKIGAFIIFTLASATSLFMALQLEPRKTYKWAREQWKQRKVRKREEALRSGDIKTVLRTREEEITERQKLIERELARRGRGIKLLPETKSKLPEATTKPSLLQEKAVTPLTSSELEPILKIEKPEYKITRTIKDRSLPYPPPQSTPVGPYHLPPISLLKNTSEAKFIQDSKEDIAKRGAIIETTLKDFGIEVRMGEITQGATITRFEIIPSPGVKVERIVSLQNNLSLALKADRVNILAPVAGKGTVGIEVANTTKAPVIIRELIESSEFQNSKARIPLALGKDVYGKTIIADLTDMPHLLIAGSTGSGKSVCINSIITSILYRFSPEDMRLILIDPKVVELQIYNSLPHLVVPVVSDPKKIIVALRWIIREMEMRYKIMAKVGVRSVTAFNSRLKSRKGTAPSKIEDSDHPKKEVPGEGTDQPLLIPENDVAIPEHIPYIIVFIDELADLMLTAPVDAEDAITRVTQMARAAGIHLIVATQTPRADVVTGTIKTNLPAKIAFRVASKVDSRVILDENGAENLLGKGDMIYKSSDSSVLCRAQDAFISDEEVRSLVDYCAMQIPAHYDTDIQEKLSKNTHDRRETSEEDERLIAQCIQIIQQEGRASTSLLQRRLRLGYTRAARIMDILEERKVVGPAQGAKDREILIRLDGAPPES